MKTITRMLTVGFLLALAAAGVSTSWAATPPVWVNYQGVLRDNADNPLDGTHDMVFRFYSGLDEEILIDRHTTTLGGAVTVSGGLFSVALGTGSTEDGSGPGTYSSLVEVFRDYNEVHLEVQVGADGEPGTEVLTPRTRVISAAYALNASNLAGLPATSLLRSNESDAYTFGTLTFGPTTTLDLGGTLNMDGAVTKSTTDHVANFNADMLDNMDSAAFSLVGHGHTGGEITGPVGQAYTLEGFDSSYFLNTSSEIQTKTGPLNVDASGIPGSQGVWAWGNDTGGYFQSAGGVFAHVAHTNASSETFGVWAQGNTAGGHFQVQGGAGSARAGYRDALGDYYGVWAEGDEAGGHFEDRNGTGWANVGYFDEGISAHGTVQGGYFQDDDSTGRAHVAYGDRGIEASGSEAGGYFEDSDGTGYAFVGEGFHGIRAWGNVSGGYFEDPIDLGHAYVGHGNRGISAYGFFAGGYFEDTDQSGYAWVGATDSGIAGYGRFSGGSFYDDDSSGYAHVGHGDYGISAFGSETGGYFEDSDDGGFAHVGYSTLGITAYGTFAGGHFTDSEASGVAWVGRGDYGITAYGPFTGGYFEDSDGSGHAYLGYAERGIWARGNFAGGTFSHPDGTTYWSDVATPTHKISGTGVDGFVQNHPFDENKVLYYSAPEGDEVAVYTRGTARLVAGEATVALGETFKWVANPDVGLTAHLTPQGDCLGLYTAALSPEQLVVRELGGGTSDVVFDYIVYGLRIGFEELAVVDTKEREASLPAPEVFESKYSADPELRQFNALERYKSMKADVSGVAVDQIELSGAAALREAIVASGWQQRGRLEQNQERPESAMPEVPAPRGEREPASEADVGVGTIAVVEATDTSSAFDRGPESNPYPTFPVSEPVEVGDLLAMDPEHPGGLTHASSASDPTVVGIVAGEPLEGAEGTLAPVAGYGFVVVKADAGYGEIRPGDLLTSSFTPGHAMRAGEIIPGTIIGKALEPLQTGTGLIKVLVMPR